MKLGLVLDGGGGKGAYQIGVWRAMREFGLDRQVKAIAGTSVGGLNAALFIQRDFDKALRIWTKDLANVHPLRLQMDVDELIERNLDFSVFQRSSIDCYLAAYSPGKKENYVETDGMGGIEKYVNGKITYYNLRTLSKKRCCALLHHCSTTKAVLLATSAFPVLCGFVFIDGKAHIDGGVPWGGDNSPIYPLSWHESNCDTLLVIHLSHFTEIDKAQFPGVRILEIVPNLNSQELGFLTGTLNFDPAHAQRLIDAGYHDSCVVFEKMMSYHTIAERENAALNRKSQLEEQHQHDLADIYRGFKELWHKEDV